LRDKEIRLKAKKAKMRRRGDELCDSGHCFSNAVAEQVTASRKLEILARDSMVSMGSEGQGSVVGEADLGKPHFSWLCLS